MGEGRLPLRLLGLLMLVAALTAGDVLTTNRIIAIGLGFEGNGIISLLMEFFGKLWWIPKAAAAAVFAVVADRMWNRLPARIAFGVVTAYYVVIIARHLMILYVAAEIKRLCG